MSTASTSTGSACGHSPAQQQALSRSTAIQDTEASTTLSLDPTDSHTRTYTGKKQLPRRHLPSGWTGRNERGKNHSDLISAPCASSFTSFLHGCSSQCCLCPTWAHWAVRGGRSNGRPPAPVHIPHPRSPLLSPPLPYPSHSASLWLVGSQWDKTLSVISASWVPRASLIIL